MSRTNERTTTVPTQKLDFTATILHLATSVRYGFATNSSSSHSILLVHEQYIGFQEDAPTPGNYGWEWFALSTEKSKLEYLWTDIYLQIRELLPSEYGIHSQIDPDDTCGFNAACTRLAEKAASDILEYKPDFKPEDGLGIDHDSCFSWPIDPERNLPSKDFALWFKNQVLNPQVTIFGGNDNDDSRSRNAPGVQLAPYLSDDEFERPRFCLDRENHWLLFQPSSGWKCRVPKVKGTPIERTTHPELVDIKVTDYCNMGCTFCYQGSTKEGVHTDMNTYDIISLLKGLEVLEVAIGGGEPMLWPNISNFIHALHGNKIIANVTTRRPELISSDLLDKISSVGISVDSVKDLNRHLNKIEYNERGDSPWFNKIVVHIVLGVTPVDEIIKIAKRAKEVHASILLLGFKEDGFGSKYPRVSEEGWIDAFVKTFKKGYWSGPNVGVDTAIVQKYGVDIQKQLNVQEKYMVAKEGAFSMYLDLVNSTFAKASYGNEKTYPMTIDNSDYKCRKLAETILKTFRTW